MQAAEVNRGSLAVITATMAFVLVACGGAEEPNNGSPTPPTSGSTSPSPTPVPGEAVTFRTSDGVPIAGRLFGEGRVGVVLGHSIDGDQTEWWNFAEVVADAGHAALAIDFRGYCPGAEGGCSGDGNTADAWRDLLAGAEFLRERGVEEIVLAGASMGGTTAIVSAAHARPAVAGVITLSSPIACCGMDVARPAVGAIGAPMLFIAGRFDGDAPRSAKVFARWAGPRGQALILATGEHGTDLFGLATPQVERRTTTAILDFLAGLGGGSVASVFGDWRWVRSCEAFVATFRRADLSDLTTRWLVSARYFAREDQIALDDPCDGAEETPYVYFFEESGRWGVLDDDDVLVDDRDFSVVDEDTIAFGDVEIDYRIDADELTFDVAIPGACDGTCLEDHAWALATFAPGSFRRVA
ncbi:MAG TPA: alpha/beta hydrolase [Actinomycetota bacterium]